MTLIVYNKFKTISPFPVANWVEGDYRNSEVAAFHSWQL